MRPLFGGQSGRNVPLKFVGDGVFVSWCIMVVYWPCWFWDFFITERLFKVCICEWFGF